MFVIATTLVITLCIVSYSDAWMPSAQREQTEGAKYGAH
jgi:hypothetical protein